MTCEQAIRDGASVRETNVEAGRELAGPAEHEGHASHHNTTAVGNVGTVVAGDCPEVEDG